MKYSPFIYTGSLVATLLRQCLAAGGSEANSSQYQDPVLLLSSDPMFHFRMLAPFGQAASGGVDIAPMLGVAKAIEAGNMESFTEEFYKLAVKTKAQAEDPANSFDPINVRDTWFSASTYYRKASNYVLRDFDDPRIKDYWVDQTEAFNKGIAALTIPGERLLIPAPEGNFTVEAVWYAASHEQVKAPTLIVGNGFDAAQEDSYHVYCGPALARGWNCITYEGPGQPTVRRNQNIGFIPNWELAVTPVVDWLMQEKAHRVDTEKLALLGNSLGGYLAARATAFEPRIKAALLVGGIWNFGSTLFNTMVPEPLAASFETGDYEAFDEGIYELRNSTGIPTSLAWAIDQALWAFNTRSPAEMFNKALEFKVEDFIEKIKVPVFVGDGEFDVSVAGQPEKVAQALGDKATLHKFMGVAGYHVQAGAGQELTRTLFAWLNKTLG
ncbi:putative hydrolases or acyltransferase [Polyplosphaeria fusca]|uniref:Hydrolases or acyltransferase n=1 Tax=Polyplosphaeria fusca TaxID=682080 RepID=A0A9P4RCG6_9PLEO|nr:putative hydrolases or acyltransferase [Polyplosphaeria fusca]